MRRILFLLVTLLVAPTVPAQSLTAEQQIKAAVSAAPTEMQAGAAVYGYDAAGKFVRLREGLNDLICLADEPGDERWHVACYHKSLDPFMARGRALRLEGKSREEIEQIREEEARSGKVTLPPTPTALYSLTGATDAFDAATGEVKEAGRLYVVYIPYATPESTGLTTMPAPGVPWLMNPGKPWAHIMLMPAE